MYYIYKIDHGKFQISNFHTCINRNLLLCIGNFPWWLCAFEFEKEICSINHGRNGNLLRLKGIL